MVVVVTSESEADLLNLTTKPTDISAVKGLLQQIVIGANDLLTSGDEQVRYDVLNKARALVLALQTPRETMVEHCWAQTSAMGAFNLGIDKGLWKLMAKNGLRPQKVADLARELGIDPALLSRLLRHLSAMGYLEETASDEYKPNNFIKCLSLPVISDGYPSVLSCAKAPIMFHEYARAHNWTNPEDPHDSPNMFANKTDKGFFKYIQQLGYGNHFNHHMGGYRLGCKRWMTDYYPVRERLIDGADCTEAPFLVDMGGNVGHELMLFGKNFPDHPGKLVLQDLPVTVKEASPEALGPAVDIIPHDLFKEQPVKGARAYFMHSIMHCWPDSMCKDVLLQVRKAMKPGYSRLLINDHVIPPTNAHWETSALDVLMMTLHAAKERTIPEWHYLIEDLAGLKIIKIWDGGRGNESLIECEVPL